MPEFNTPYYVIDSALYSELVSWSPDIEDIIKSTFSYADGYYYCPMDTDFPVDFLDLIGDPSMLPVMQYLASTKWTAYA